MQIWPCPDSQGAPLVTSLVTSHLRSCHEPALAFWWTCTAERRCKPCSGAYLKRMLIEVGYPLPLHKSAQGGWACWTRCDRLCQKQRGAPTASQNASAADGLRKSRLQVCLQRSRQVLACSSAQRPLRNKSRRQTVIQHGCIKGRRRYIKIQLGDNKGRLGAEPGR